MSVGLPGTGIGGLFYLMGALWMPAQEVLRAAAGAPGPRRWGPALGQFSLAATIILAIWGTGWLLGMLLLPEAASGGIAGATAATQAGPGQGNVLRAVAVVGTLGILGAVLLAVQALRLLVRHPRPVAALQPGPQPSPVSKAA